LGIGSLISVYGLMLDILGAWYLARALVKKTLEEIKKEAPKFSAGIYEVYVVGALHQKIESKFGFAFLFIGFSFQIAPYFLCDKYKSISVSIWWFFIGIIISLMLRFILEFFVKKAKNKLVKEFLKAQIFDYKYSLNNPMQIDNFKSYFGCLGKKYSNGASQEELWKELCKLLGIER